jgi:phytanoyl-CoA hydroxylase
VCPHQDGTFLYTEPQSCIGFWWPLDDCSEQNGCLYVVPGSHSVSVQRRFRRRNPPDDNATGTTASCIALYCICIMFIYVCASAAEFVPLELPDWTEQLKDAVPLQTRRGSLVILHNALIHYSNENNSGQVGIYLCSSLYQLSGRLQIFYKFIYLYLGYYYTYTPYIHT